MSGLKIGVIVGGTGAQGAAIVRHLSSLGKYHLRVLTRDISSKQAKVLTQLPNVELVRSSPAGYDDQSFLIAAKNADFAFINTDGFSVGEAAETYWGIRFYELARTAKIKHFLYSSFDNTQELTDYQEKFHVGHYSGKSRVVDFLRTKPISIQNGATYWSVITSGPYMEMLHESLKPEVNADGSAIFRFPLDRGALPLIHLDDFASYVEYMLESPEEVAGTELKIATVHASGEDIAVAYTTVTGLPARYENVPINHWLEAAFGHETRGINTPVGQATLRRMMSAEVEKLFFPLTFGQNFERFWNLWKASGGNNGVIRRDYDHLDRVLPDRVRSIEEWMREVDYTGGRREVLKQLNDRLAQTSDSTNARE